MNRNYTPCSFGSQCKYQYEPAKFGIVTKECDRGYNSNGQGYCPIGHDTDEKGWRNYYSTLKKEYNNNAAI